jgi:hypothetical protein
MIGLLTAPTASLAELGGFSLKRQPGDKYLFIGCREDEVTILPAWDYVRHLW